MVVEHCIDPLDESLRVGREVRQRVVIEEEIPHAVQVEGPPHAQPRVEQNGGGVCAGPSRAHDLAVGPETRSIPIAIVAHRVLPHGAHRPQRRDVLERALAEEDEVHGPSVGERPRGLLDADRLRGGARPCDDGLHGRESTTRDERLELLVQRGERVARGRGEVAPGRDADALAAGPLHERSREGGVTLRVPGTIRRRSRVCRERRVEDRAVRPHGVEQLGEDLGLCVEGGVLRHDVVVVHVGHLGHRLPRQVARVRDHVHAALDDLQRAGREDHAVRPHLHALAVGLRGDPGDLRCGQVRVDLHARRRCALRAGHRGDDVGLWADRLHPGHLARGVSRGGGLRTRVGHEGRARHDSGIEDVWGDDLGETGVASARASPAMSRTAVTPAYRSLCSSASALGRSGAVLRWT